MLCRFLGIWFPMKKGLTRGRARIIIVLIWMMACIVILPWALVFDLVEQAGQTFCVEIWPSYADGDLYFLVGNLLLCYLLPLTCIFLCYSLILFRVMQRKVLRENASITGVKRIHREARYGVLKMLVVVILAFLLSWLPLYVIFTRIKFGPQLDWEHSFYAIIAPLAQWLSSSNSCINPILYGFLNAKFRQAFLDVSPWGRRPRKSPVLQKRLAFKLMYNVRKPVGGTPV